MIHELRQFCEDNNWPPPAPMRVVPARAELNYWSAADPALDIEAADAVEMRGGTGRACYIQRVIYDLRYSLYLENGAEFERGTLPDVLTGLEVARVWLGGGGMMDLPGRRGVIL
jgi:hypothetical protein